MLILDTSSIVYGWDNYPIKHFPKLWEWLSIQISDDLLVIPSIAAQEVNNVSQECWDWLDKQSIKQFPPTNAILREASRIKSVIGIKDDKYGPTGVGENDIIIISTAKIHGGILISDESKQPTLPKNPANIKIPAVCDLPQVKQPCINFLEYITSSNAVFG